jgi:flagellin
LTFINERENNTRGNLIMRINTNVNAMLATNNNAANVSAAGKSMQKLASGLRINTAADDAAGLAVSEKMRAQIRGMEQADMNVQDGISLIQTTEGALGEATNVAQRMRELCIQAGNDTLSKTDREKIKTEIDALAEELANIAEETKFNDVELLSKKQDLTIQAGANSETRTVATFNLTAEAQKVEDLNVTDNTEASKSAGVLDALIEEMSKARAGLGAVQNRLEYVSANLTTAAENLTEADSRIRDVDVAKEMTTLAKLNLLTQTSQAMISQAQSQPEGITNLLR